MLAIVLASVIMMLITKAISNEPVFGCFILGALVGLDVAFIVGPFFLKSIWKQAIAAILALADTGGFILVPTAPPKECF